MSSITEINGQPYVNLNSGAMMPLMGFGTLMGSLQFDESVAIQMVKDALDIGYRHIDTAQVYRTEPAVGTAVREKIQDGTIRREDVFITTKLWRNAVARDAVVPSLRKSLESLQLDYVDLFLIHWPTSFQQGEAMFPKDESGKYIYGDVDYLDTWKGMEECVKLGLTKSIGLSNFNSKQIQRLMDNASIKPANNQIESHPFLTNTKVIRFCQNQGISVAVYAPLGGFNPRLREEKGWPTIYSDKVIEEIAVRHRHTPAQVALRYQIQRGVAPLPKSAKRQRLIENFEALHFALTDDEMKAIDSCDSNMRLNAEFPDHPLYPFHEEF